MPTEVIDEYHMHPVPVNETLAPRQLRGDGTDRAQAGRVWTGQREPEPVSDVRLPSLPLKCYGNFPLIMLPDGRVRRMLPTDFLAVGGQAWSVGWGLSGIEAGGEYDKEELERLKTLGGNTWDAALARITVTALATVYAAVPGGTSSGAGGAGTDGGAFRLPAEQSEAAGEEGAAEVAEHSGTLRSGLAALPSGCGGGHHPAARAADSTTRRRKARKPGDDEGDAGMRDAGSDDDGAEPGRGVYGDGDVLTPGPAAGQSTVDEHVLDGTTRRGDDGQVRVHEVHACRRRRHADDTPNSH